MKHSEGFLNLVNDAKTRVREVSVAETLQRMRDNPEAKLIDVREDDEWNAAPPGLGRFGRLDLRRRRHGTSLAPSPGAFKAPPRQTS